MKPTARRTIRPTITSWFISPSVSVTTTEAITSLSSTGKRNSSEGSCDFPPRLAAKNNTPPSIPGHHTDVRTCSLVATNVHISKQQRNALEGLVSKRRARSYWSGRSKYWAKVKDRKHPATMEKSSRGRMASLGCFLASVAFKTRRSA